MSLWRLVDSEGRPFGGGGIYLRVSRCEHGPFGMRRLVVGLPRWRIIGERKERADRLFPFAPPLAARGRCR